MRAFLFEEPLHAVGDTRFFLLFLFVAVAASAHHSAILHLGQTGCGEDAYEGKEKKFSG